MTTLAADKARDFQVGEIEEYPVIATDTIYEGAAVGENASGYARPLVAGDKFLGFAIEKVENTGAAGAKNVRVRTRGRVVVPLTGTIADNDRPAVYASDDDTFTKSSSNNSLIGYVSRWISNSQAVVEFDAVLSRLI
jgi:hypothetical protein